MVLNVMCYFFETRCMFFTDNGFLHVKASHARLYVVLHNYMTIHSDYLQMWRARYVRCRTSANDRRLVQKQRDASRQATEVNTQTYVDGRTGRRARRQTHYDGCSLDRSHTKQASERASEGPARQVTMRWNRGLVRPFQPLRTVH